MLILKELNTEDRDDQKKGPELERRKTGTGTVSVRRDSACEGYESGFKG